VILRELAAALATEVIVGKRILLIVGTVRESVAYHELVEKLVKLAPPTQRGHVTVLCACENNGSDWKLLGYDRVEVCPSAMPYPEWQDLAREGALRATPTMGKPKPLPRALRQAIKRGRRPKGSGLEG